MANASAGSSRCAAASREAIQSRASAASKTMNPVRSGGEKLIAALTRAIPVGRLGQPEDVAVAVAMFASPDAGFITGQTLSVSGGMSMA